MEVFTQFLNSLDSDPFLALRFRQDPSCRKEVLEAQGLIGANCEQALTALASGEESVIAEAFGCSAASYFFVVVVIDSQQPVEVAA
ncbi:MAG: hypothetical protein H7Y37_20725 [Anaerolineae bacterium]|nr:hypothetical protein [Gloeobacterales cyanobacterium ES-bin-313]